MIGMTNSGAGGGISLKVKGGTTAPANPTENLVWVNTSETITKTIVSYDEPASPTAGTVWIKPADNGNNTVSLSRRDTVVLRVGVVSQYISSAWVGKDAQVYVSGSWVPIQSWVYNMGTSYSNFTTEIGGGGKFEDKSADGYLRIGDNGSASAWKNVCLYTQNKVNSKDMHALHISVSPETSSGFFDFGISSENQSYNAIAGLSGGAIVPRADALACARVGSPSSGEAATFVQGQEQEWVCDLSSVTEDGYVCIHVGSYSQSTSTPRIDAYKIWFT